MSSAFATKWDFLLGTVLIGVDRGSGVFSGSEPTPGRQHVAVWTSDALASEALHTESWNIKKITVRRLLAILPPGIGVHVDPGRPTGMTATGDYVAQLKTLVAPFPDGSVVQRAEWDGIDDAVRQALASAAADHVREMYAFGYTVGDSPVIGCLAFVATPGSEATAGAVLEEALDRAADLPALRVPTVNIVSLDEVPAALRSTLGDADVVVRQRRRRLWRR